LQKTDHHKGCKKLIITKVCKKLIITKVAKSDHHKGCKKLIITKVAKTDHHKPTKSCSLHAAVRNISHPKFLERQCMCLGYNVTTDSKLKVMKMPQ